MLFNSFVFLFVFLPLVVVAYFALPQHRARLALIVLASYVFYAYAKWWFALLMAASTLVGFVGGLALGATLSHSHDGYRDRSYDRRCNDDFAQAPPRDRCRP